MTFTARQDALDWRKLDQEDCCTSLYEIVAALRRMGKYALAAPRPKTPRDIQAERIARILLRLKSWEAKRKRAETAIKKLRKQVKYYERKARR